MHANISFGLPLTLILVKAVEVTCGVVEKNALWGQAVEEFWLFVLRYCLEEASFLASIDHVEALLANGAKVDEELHAETAGEKRFICGLTHFKKCFDAVVLPLPWKHVRIALDHHDVNQVEPLYKIEMVSYA